MSRNLQNIEHAKELGQTPEIMHRFTALIWRSEQHAAAAKAFVNVLEDLIESSRTRLKPYQPRTYEHSSTTEL